MTNSREMFLERVRQAVAAGNRAGMANALEPRGSVGYQGSGPDPVGRFCEGFRAAGGIPHVVAANEEAIQKVLELVRAKAAHKVLLGRGTFLDTLGLASRLPELGVTVIPTDALTPETSRERFFDADIGISSVNYSIGETGSMVVMAQRDDPRSLSLLPPIHVAVAHRTQILPDLFDLFDLFEGNSAAEGQGLPSCLTLITGPSKTGDIELRLVTGVHGPGELHVVLVDERSSALGWETASVAASLPPE